jgi:hypothetical protein
VVIKCCPRAVEIVKKICCENYANKEGAMLSNYLRQTQVLYLGDDCIAFENFTASIGDIASPVNSICDH